MIFMRIKTLISKKIQPKPSQQAFAYLDPKRVRTLSILQHLHFLSTISFDRALALLAQHSIN